MIYQHATEERDRLIADSIGDAIAEWQAEQNGDDGDDDGSAGVPAAV